MIDESFRIYIEQLRDGRVEALQEVFSPDFMDIHEKELAFPDPIVVNGSAYIADDTLLLNLNVSTQCTLLCKICNEPVRQAIVIEGAYYPIPLNEIKGSVFDFRETLREAILVEAPQLAECHHGKCPLRKSIQKYLTKEEECKKNDEGKYYPFADIDTI